MPVSSNPVIGQTDPTRARFNLITRCQTCHRSCDVETLSFCPSCSALFCLDCSCSHGNPDFNALTAAALVEFESHHGTTIQAALHGKQAALSIEDESGVLEYVQGDVDHLLQEAPQMDSELSQQLPDIFMSRMHFARQGDAILTSLPQNYLCEVGDDLWEACIVPFIVEERAYTVTLFTWQ
jgi:hypothetical protein